MRSAVLLLIATAAWAAEAPPSISPDEVLQKMTAGNQRFAAGKATHPNASVERRQALAGGQNPYAVVLGCSDSRVPPEIIFDAGLGDLFVIRDAGNTIDDEVLGSIEYAVEHLGSRLIMVLGHEKCGAVTAAVQGGKAEGHLTAVVGAIQPVVAEAKKQSGDAVHNCVAANARRTAAQLRESQPLLKGMVASGKVKVVAADYDVATGQVTILK